MALTGTEQHQWWKESVVYQIYPSSFLDANGDGWGDLKGMISKVDYLKSLGVDVVWVSPIYKSPQVDMGYDIADYKSIDPRYGSIEDVDTLIAELKMRGMKLMMDLVVNHTSNQHPWFLESRSSLNNPKRDWYIWKIPKYDENGNPQPPNNWSMILGEANSAWTYDKTTNEYYLSLFSPEQPDLNWENPEVRKAVHDIMRFWLERGVCGFRMDVINLISKIQTFPDAEPVLGPDHKYHPGSKYYVNGPRLHEFLKEMRQEVLSKYDAITVGEMPYVSDVDEILRVVSTKEGELNMIFIFDIVDIDNIPGKVRLTLQDWTVRDLKNIVTKWQRTMIDRDGWNSVFIENHDNARSVSRYTDDSDATRHPAAKLLAMLQTTLGGTLYVYQGEEIGMRNVPTSWSPETEYKDIDSVNFWKKCKALYANDPEKLAHGLEVLQRKARDNARTPVQWSAKAPNAGFCAPGVRPWMRVNDDYAVCNVEAQMASHNSPDDDDHHHGMSVWQFWQMALRTRKELVDVFVYGDYRVVDPDHESVFAYLRTGAVHGRYLVVLNWCSETTEWDIPPEFNVTEWVVESCKKKGASGMALHGKVRLGPWEGVLGKCVSPN
ncbi:MAG: hypothetical protein M1834_008148 [Cirrosporium novae-zelandiae]|nr:MAG: hypothetical protein M1834_008148 [Cirrosporium novae-zelandiae]